VLDPAALIQCPRLFFAPPRARFSSSCAPPPPPLWLAYSHTCPHPLFLERYLLRLPTDEQRSDRRRAAEPMTPNMVCIDRLPVVRSRRRLTRAFPTLAMPLLATTTVDPDDVHCAERNDFTRWGTHVALLGHLRFDSATVSAADLHAHLERLADTAFCSFERSVLHLAAADPWTVAWEARLDEYAVELALFEGLPRAMFGSLVMRACRWRIVVAALYRTWIVPARRSGDPHWNHMLVLFSSTHLDLMTLAAERAEAGLAVDDAYFLTEGAAPAPAPAPLTTVYPLPHRVVTGDELPDMTPYLLASDLFTDTNKVKGLMTMERYVVNIFMIKQQPHICYVRHLPETIRKAVARYPSIRVLLRLVIETSMLAQFAGQQTAHMTDPLGWAQRVRVHRAFRGALTSDEAFDAWMKDRVYVVFFALREWLLDQVDCYAVLQRLFTANDQKWTDFRLISRQAMHDINVALDAQARGTGGIMARFDWTSITSAEANKKTAAATRLRAITGPAHTMFLQTCKKIKKGTARQIILKKLVAVKMDVIRFHLRRCLDEHASLKQLHAYLCRRDVRVSWEVARTIPLVVVGRPGFAAYLATVPARSGVTNARLLSEAVIDWFVLRPLQARLHLVATPLRLAAMEAAREERQRRGRATPLRYLQMLGMSAAGLGEVRAWFERYTFLLQTDDGYKRWALLLGARSFYDYTIFELYMREIERCSRETIFFLPMDYYSRQVACLRRRLGLTPDMATPSELGRALYCDGCGRFASIVQATPVWAASEYDHRHMNDAVRRLKVYNDNAHLTISDFIFKLVPIGQSRASLDALSGDRFCSHAPLVKDQLKRQKVLELLATQPLAAVGLESQLDAREHMGLLATEGARAVRVLSDDVGVDDDDSDSDRSSSDEEAATPTSRKKTKKKKKKRKLNQGKPLKTYRLQQNARYRDMLSQMYEAAGNRPVMPPGNTCGHAPLVNIDMLGIVFYRHGEAYALCCYCGDLTRVMPAMWRSEGISCMNHPHLDEFPLDHFQNAAFRAVTETASQALTLDFCQPLVPRQPRIKEEAQGVLGSEQQRILHPHPQVLHDRVACSWCGTPTRKVIQVIDTVRGVIEVALCNADLRTVDMQLATDRLGLHAAPLTIFAKRATVWALLGAARRSLDRLRATTEAVAAANTALAAAAAADDERQLAASVVCLRLEKLVAEYTDDEQALVFETDAELETLVDVDAHLTLTERRNLLERFLAQLSDMFGRRSAAA
jgi:hypothetical protein